MKREVTLAALLAAVAAVGIVTVSLFLGDEARRNESPSGPLGGQPSAARDPTTLLEGTSNGSPPPAAERDRRPSRGLAGHVVDGKTERALAGLEFRVRISRGSRTETREVTADDEGGFILAGIPDGEYRVTFEHPAYFPVETELSIGKQSDPESLHVVFDRGVTVSGAVRASGGRSPGDAVVEWIAVDDPESVRRAVCGPRGKYELGGLEPGRYRVRVVPRRLASLWRDSKGDEVRLEDVPEVTRDLEVNLGRSLLVRVRRDGAPVSGVAVQFRVESRGRGVAGFLDPTDADGATTLHGLPRTGDLRLEVPDRPQGGGRRDVDLSRLPRAVTIELDENGLQG